MPVRVKCRCGQELTLRYGEWVYFLIGLVLLCLVSNSVALLLLYFRLEELSGAPLRSSAAGAASAESVLSPPEAKAQSAKAEPDANPPSGAIPETDLPAKPASAPERKSSRAERPLMPRPPDARETGAAPEASPPASGAGVPPPAAEPARLLASAVDEEPWASAPWREGSPPPKAAAKRKADGPGRGSWLRLEPLVRLCMLDLLRGDPIAFYGFLHDPDPRIRMRAVEAVLSEPVAPGESDLLARTRALARAALPELDDGSAVRIRDALELPSGDAEEAEEAALLREALDAVDRSIEQALQAADAGALRRALESTRARGLDVVLLVDATRSMENLYHALDLDLSWMLPALEWGFPDIQVGLVLYRDDVETSKGFSRPSDRELAASLRGSRAEGGGDVPEGVHHALRHALSLGRFAWRKTSEKHIVVVGDAPAPFKDQRSVLWLVSRAREEGGFRFHVLAPSLEDGKPEAFLSDLAKEGGGVYTRVSEGISPGEEIVRSLLPREAAPALEPLPASLHALFEPARDPPSPTRKKG
jgi:hypothetical protein